MNLSLVRDSVQPDPANCTLGVLTIGSQSWQTMERPWIPSPDGPCGAIGQSCIQAGVYQLTPRYTVRKGDHWHINNPELFVFKEPGDIPAGTYGRSEVLIHGANWAFQLEGCIAPGKTRLLDTQGRWMAVNSTIAMNDLRGLLGTTDDHVLTIVGVS